MGAGRFAIGSIQGDPSPDFETYLYLSFSTYTSLGIGDIYPTNELRLLCGVEALVGLLMIGWSASYIFLEMRRSLLAGSDRG